MINWGFKGFKRGFLLALVAAMVAVFAASPAFARHYSHHTRHAAHHRAAPEPDRYSSIVIDATTGYVLSEKDADVRRFPASLSKMMTLYLTFEALRDGTITKNQRIPISANAEAQEPSKLGLKEGYTIRLEDAIYGVVTRSANDAAVTLSEAVGGSEAHFARQMTFKAQQLGMRSTHFVNASGLFDPLQYSTARDIAILAQALIRDFPREYRYFSTPSFTFAGITSTNHNHLMLTYEGMDGIKTGYVHQSGYNLAASAVRDGRRLIGIVFGGRTANSRNQAMALLLDSGFQRARDPRVMALLQQRENLADARMPRRKPAVAAAQAPQLPSPAVRMAAAQGAAVPPLNPAPSPEGEGDVNEAEAAHAAPATAAAQLTAQFQPPSSLNTAIISQPPSAKTAQVKTTPTKRAPTKLAMNAPPPAPVAGTWAVQIGAYSSHDAGVSALRTALQRLPKQISGKSQYMVVPLMTNRGMIYRARLAGLDHRQADAACHKLKGSCVVLAIE